MRALWVLTALTTTGCIVIERSSDDPVVVPCCTGDSGGAASGTATTALTTTSVIEDHGLAISLTDATGPIACALSEDDELQLGRTGAQLFMRVQPGWFIGCDAGVHTVSAEDCGPGEGVPIGCARLRTWDSSGALTHEAWAVSGAVIIEEASAGRCRFDIEVVLPGGQVIAGSAVTDELDTWGNEAVCDLG